MSAVVLNIKDVEKALRDIPKALARKKVKKALEEASRPIVEGAKSRVPVAERVVKRYKPLSAGKRAARGKGNVVAEYYPGNLKRAIRILRGGKFSKSSAVFIGPKVQKRGQGAGKFSGNRVDAWYFHFIERGTMHMRARPFLRPAFDENKEKVFHLASLKFAALIDEVKGQ
ncbi:MAG: hypothetical protein KatS3mg031_2989 [Chitinophagales bacterium]|nr:MAG: hypothetical protein KatS3mg031_2989 [Chitinophagales bacterium]